MWIDIKGYENIYQVNEMGQVKSIARVKGSVFCKERLLKYDEAKLGYQRVTLCKNDKHHRVLVHRLVYETFIGEIPKGYCINHIDHNPRNNQLINLEPVTIKDNNRKKIDTKLTESKAKAIRQSILSIKQLSHLYGVSPRAVLHIKKGDRWDNI